MRASLEFFIRWVDILSIPNGEAWLPYNRYSCSSGQSKGQKSTTALTDGDGPHDGHGLVRSSFLFFERSWILPWDLHRPAQIPSPLPNPPKVRPPMTPPPPPPPPIFFPSFTGRFATRPCALTPCMTLSSCVSTTTPPTIISPSVACRVSKLKIRSSSHTFSKSPSSACTKTWIRSRRARGDSVEVDMTMK